MQILFSVAFVHLLNDCVQAVLPSIYPLLKHEFNLTFAQVGLITLTFQCTASLLQPWIGLYTDKRPIPFLLPAGMCVTLMGVGLLMLFRHRASLGGFNILCVYLQERFGWRAGLVQLGLDALILLLSLALVEPRAWLLSLLGTVVLNLTLAVNHRPGRYLAG